MKYLIKQAQFILIYFFIPLYISASMVDGYSHIQQHGSEITITNFETAKIVINTGAILTGLSCILLAIGIWLNFKKHALTSVLLILFGISIVSNGIYPMGTLMHGIYGMGMVLMILPFVAAYELKNRIKNEIFFKVSIFCGFIFFIYLWAVFLGFDPPNYRGLTQRIASVFIFGWIAYVAFTLDKNLLRHKVP